MILMIGGAYQGKLDYAKAAYQLTEHDIFVCEGPEIDFSKRCIYCLEGFAKVCPDPVGYFEARRRAWQDSVLICQDLSGGVVPMAPQDRAWRQRTGSLCQYLARNADRVSRIFCGLEQRLK